MSVPPGTTPAAPRHSPFPTDRAADARIEDELSEMGKSEYSTRNGTTCRHLSR